LPYQVAELALRSPELPRQCAREIRTRLTALISERHRIARVAEN